MKQLKQILLSYLEEWGLIKNLQKRSDVPKRGHLTVAIFSEILYNI